MVEQGKPWLDWKWYIIFCCWTYLILEMKQIVQFLVASDLLNMWFYYRSYYPETILIFLRFVKNNILNIFWLKMLSFSLFKKLKFKTKLVFHTIKYDI